MTNYREEGDGMSVRLTIFKGWSEKELLKKKYSLEKKWKEVKERVMRILLLTYSITLPPSLRSVF